MTNREIVFNQLRHIETPVVPYTIGFEGDVADRLDAHYGTPDWRKRLNYFMAEVRCVDTDRKFPADASHNRDVFGGIWRIDCFPWHLETPPLAEPNFDGYTFPKAEDFFIPDGREALCGVNSSVSSSGRCIDGKEAAREFLAAGTPNFRLAHLGWGLFERCWTLRGFENALMDAIAEPDFFQEMLDRLVELYLQFVDYTCELPIDGILFGDDWGDQQGVIIGADRWRKFLKPAWAKIYERVHASGKLVLSHSCGSVVDIIPDLVEIGLDCLESCQPEARGMNPYELKKRFGDKIAFWGCLGSQSILPFGTPENIRAEVTRLRSEMARGGGFILAPAKPLQPETPTANAVALVEALMQN